MKLSYNKKLLLPFIIAVSSYLLAYLIPKVAIIQNNLHFLIMSIDKQIPLYSWTIIIYLGAFFQWINAILIGIKQETKKGYKFASAIIIGSFIGFIIFMVYPTAVSRPTIECHNIFDYIIDFVFSVDSIVNAFPSFHCFCSTIVVLMLIESKDIKPKTVVFNIIFSLMVFASTLFTKQHYFIDVPFGILLALISFKLANKITFTKLFDKLNQKIELN